MEGQWQSSRRLGLRLTRALGLSSGRWGMATKLLQACSSPTLTRGIKLGGKKIFLTSLGYIPTLELVLFTALLNRDKATNVNINQTSP
jgi:hypothetical protein